jgi:hypothetical protein
MRLVDTTNGFGNAYGYGFGYGYGEKPASSKGAGFGSERLVTVVD